MIPPAELAQMLVQRAADPHLAVVEAVLLRDTIEAFDDFLTGLELHTWHAHGAHTVSAEATVRTIAAARLHLMRLVDQVDIRLAGVNAE